MSTWQNEIIFGQIHDFVLHEGSEMFWSAAIHLLRYGNHWSDIRLEKHMNDGENGYGHVAFLLPTITWTISLFMPLIHMVADFYHVLFSPGAQNTKARQMAVCRVFVSLPAGTTTRNNRDATRHMYCEHFTFYKSCICRVKGENSAFSILLIRSTSRKTVRRTAWGHLLFVFSTLRLARRSGDNTTNRYFGMAQIVNQNFKHYSATSWRLI